MDPLLQNLRKLHWALTSLQATLELDLVMRGVRAPRLQLPPTSRSRAELIERFRRPMLLQGSGATPESKLQRPRLLAPPKR